MSATANLRAFLDRIERLQDERKTIADDIAEVFKELESAGFDKIAAKAVLKIRSTDDGIAKWTERSAILDLYLAELGMLPAPAPARTREIIEQFPPSIASVSPSGHARKGGDDANAGGDHEVVTPNLIEKIDCDLIEQDVTPRADAEALGSTVELGAPEFEPPAFLKRDHQPLRPHCQNPNDCAGYGSTHCGSCLRASRAVEAA